MMRFAFGAGALATCLAIGPVQAAAPKYGPKPEIFSRLLDCRTVATESARLACYDKEVAAMDQAAKDDEVVVLDKEGLRKTRRSLFGFSLPNLPFLGGDGDEGKRSESSLIEAKIAAVQSLGNGRYALKLDDGALWQTTEELFNRVPKVDMPIVIKRAAMGSFMATIGGRGVRIKRVG
ncbi:hypothetical protein BH11PSE5_BH11PSE5_11220 [soil metagenome]|nr:hypothetical protein [Sphingobium sp. CECT 9361]GLI97298.1 hypothetical protein Sbs19_11160 [Sphingobium sp. BS19]CAH0351920.1 hypothetical protein SPH9361_01680 [Sphingobium sp. CECT 9361]